MHVVVQFGRKPFQCSGSVNELEKAQICRMKLYFLTKNV